VRAQATPLAVLIRTYVGSSAGLQFLGHPAMTQKWPVVSQTPNIACALKPTSGFCESANCMLIPK